MRKRYQVVLVLVALLTVLSLVVAGCGETATPTPTKAAAAATAAPGGTAVAAMGTPTPAAPVATPTKAPKLGGKLVLISSADSTGANLDANLIGARTSSYWMGPIYDSLIRHSFADYELIPGLAEKWSTSPDGKEITLNLRKGVKWHNIAPVNGREFTADDVKYNLERIRDTKVTGAVQWRTSLQVLESVQVVDKYTVKLILKSANAPFLYNLADNSFMMYPKELVDSLGDKQAKAAVGTGPFKFVSYEPSASLKLAKNPDYWEAGLPRLDSIDYVVVADPAARLSAMRSGQANYWDSMDKGQRDGLKSSNPTMQFYQHAGYGYAIRLQTIDTPFKDVKVRKALSLAINRPDLIALPLEGEGNLLGLHRPEVTPAGVYRKPAELKDLPGYRVPKTADIAEAKKLLAEAGYASGLTIKAAVYKDDSRIVKINEVLKSQLAEVGITWNLELYDYATLGDLLVTNGKFQAAIFYQTSGDADTTDYMSYHSSAPSSKLLGYSDPDVDKLLEAGRVEPDMAKRTAIYRQFEDLVLTRTYWRIPLVESVNYMAVSPEFREIKPMFGAGFQFFVGSFKDAWIDK